MSSDSLRIQILICRCMSWTMKAVILFTLWASCSAMPTTHSEEESGATCGYEVSVHRIRPSIWILRNIILQLPLPGHEYQYEYALYIFNYYSLLQRNLGVKSLAWMNLKKRCFRCEYKSNINEYCFHNFFKLLLDVQN